MDRELQIESLVIYVPADPLRITYSIKHRYEGRSLRGFAGSFSDDLKKELESSDTVKYVGTFGLLLLLLYLSSRSTLGRGRRRGDDAVKAAPLSSPYTLTTPLRAKQAVNRRCSTVLYFSPRFCFFFADPAVGRRWC